MKTQQYANHVRYYPPHHFIFTRSLFFAFTGIRGIWLDAANKWLWIVVTLLTAITG